MLSYLKHLFSSSAAPAPAPAASVAVLAQAHAVGAAGALSSGRPARRAREARLWARFSRHRAAPHDGPKFARRRFFEVASATSTAARLLGPDVARQFR